MGKVGAALDAQRIQQGGGTPTPSETLRRVLNKALGSVSDSVEIQPETVLQNVPQTQPQIELDPVASETAGFTPEGELLPLEERFQNYQNGVSRPQFNDWQNSGQTVNPNFARPAPANLGPNNDQTNAISIPAPRDPVLDFLSRAERQASMMDPTDRSTPTIRVRDTNVTDKRVKEEWIDNNKRMAMSVDPAEMEALRKRQYELANADNRESTILGSYLDKLNAMSIDPRTGYASPNQNFLKVGAMATEHALDGLFLGTSDDYEQVMIGEAESRPSQDLVNPSDAAERVGRQVVKWWDAEKKAEGETINPNLNAQELKDIGGMFLLSYAKANPNLINIVNTKPDAEGNYVKDETGRAIRFELTPEGNVVYDANRAAREEAMGIVIDPLIQPAPGNRGAAEREKPAYRNKSAIKGEGRSPAYATLDEFEESIENQNGVAHIVDDRRTRIVSAMLIPSLYAPIGTKNDMFGDMFGIGESSFETTRLEKKLLNGLDEQAAFDEAVKITNSKKKEASEDVMTAIRFRGRPNYLTMAMQPLAGRMMAQQSKFNPTRKKIIRFVTRSKHPATITGKGSKAWKAYMNIMALSFGADAKLEKGRLADLEVNKEKYYGWGKLLENALNDTIPQEAYEVIAKQIRAGRPLPQGAAQNLVKFQKAIKSDPGLLELLLEKGEDAPMAIDALIDFKNFNDAMDAGRPHMTFVNAYVDGKTNGIANQGMMLGNEELAVRVGALRGDGATEAVEGGDVRKAMANRIVDRLEQTIPVIPEEKYAGNAGKYHDIKTVLQILGSEKTINKAISMIFPYGKELGGMRGEIEKLIPEMRANNKELDALMNSLDMDADLINAAHDNVVYALFDIFGEDTFNTRGIMRSVGFMHAIADQIFSLRGPAGHRIFLGDRRVSDNPEHVTRSTVAVQDPNGVAHQLTLQNSKTYMSSAAKKDGEAAGYVRGRAAVIPTQSIDAATVVRTTTGASWERLKDAHPAGDPYFFQIYDAFKVDVHSYQTIVHEANRNFLDITTRDWNFVEEAMKEYRRLSDYFRKVMQADPDRVHNFQGRFEYILDLMNPEVRSMGGIPLPQRSNMKTFTRAAYPINPKLKYSEKGFEKMNEEDLKKMTPQDIQRGYEKFIDEKAKVLQRKMFQAYNENARGEVKKIQPDNFSNRLTLPKLISSRQALAIFDVLESEIGLDQRLSELTMKTNRNRARLRNKILDRYKRRGDWVAQFWAH